jgi:hypothetical protein
MDVFIYLEGGGDRADSRKMLREGMDAFLRTLKQAARDQCCGWRLVPCGSHQSALDKFMAAVAQRPSDMNLLLVDAEGPLSSPDPRKHLQAGGGRTIDCEAEHVHLMVQCMETWIVADDGALAAFYGQHFQANALPRAQDLESVDKERIAQALKDATRHTPKGSYHKIRHGSALLGRIDPAMVRARCRYSDRLFVVVETQIRGT